MRSAESAERKRAYNRAYGKVYRQTHPRTPLTPHARAVKREYQRTRWLVYSKAYREANKDRLAAARSVRYKKTRSTPEGVERLKARANLSNAVLREKIFESYGRMCACCGETDTAFLTLDHVNGGGQEHHRLRKDGTRLPHRATGIRVYRAVQREGFPKDKYRLLCMNCNWATRFGKKCPHQQTVEALIESLDMVGVS